MVEKFIKRPVLSLVISIFIVLLGVLSLMTLPTTQFPDIVPPSVLVTAKYTGANAEVCAKAVGMPLERAINGVPGMTYMTTVTGNDGVTLITVFFKVGVDPDVAAVSVQNRVTTVLDELPEEVIKAGVTTEKEVNSMLMYLNIFSEDTTMNEKFIFNFADINILKELKRIDGVGRAEILGQQEYAMRVWLNPEKMKSYNISVDEVITALRAQNVEAAPGKVGESSGKDPNALQYVLKYRGKFTNSREYGNIILRATSDGAILRLKNIAEIEFGSMSYGMLSNTNGKPSASILIKQRPESNAQEVIENIKNKMAELKMESFPPGMTYNLAYDVSRFLDASIHEVLKTLVEAFILVSIVVFIFLQDWRSTLIPALAVPVSLIGTLAFMQAMGFSINLLTLFALVLAIGIVVDDAIVVVEAVHVKMHEEHVNPKVATIQAMRQIAGAIVAITFVMAAVFIPVSFMSGPVGVFYRQFSLTLAVAIIISGINALTLTPVLCTIILKHDPNRKKNLFDKFFDQFNIGYNKVENKYKGILARIVSRRIITVGALALFCVLIVGVNKILPTGFIPMEDQGMLYVNVTTPPGATVERTERILSKITEMALEIEEVENISTLAGYDVINEIAGASYGMGMINMKAWDDRARTVDEIMDELKSKSRGLADATIEFFPPPTVPGFGNAGGFEFRILDKTGSSDLSRLSEITDKFIDLLRQNPAISSAFTSFNVNFPQYMVEIDYEMAAKKGITVDNAMSTLQTLIGSYYTTNFIRFDQMYRVMLQAHPSERRTPDDLLELFVKNAAGEQVPYSSFVKMKRVFGPEQLTRYNMYNSAMVNGDAAKGYSSGDAIAAIRSVADEVLPKGYSYEFTGMTREEIESGNQVVFIFSIALLFVYLILSAQYESFILPLPVILCLPAGIFGAFISLKLAGLDNNIYAQVSLVMLIGLLGKNAILIIEFAEQRRREGISIVKAAIEGSVARLRPILMTSFAFVAGLIPLCVASGAGAIGNRTIGTSAAGGMFIGTIFGLFLIPGLYVLFSRKKRNVIEKNEEKDEIEL